MLAIDAGGEEQIGPLIEEAQSGRQDSDDGVRLAVDVQPKTDDVRIRAQPALPVTVAQHDRLRCTRRVVFRGERTADHGSHAQQLEHALGDLDAGQLLRLLEPGHGDRARVPQSDVDKGLVRVAVGVVDRGRLRQDVRSDTGSGVPHRHQSVRVLECEGLDQHAVHHAEDRGVAADAQREGDDAHRGEHRLAGQRSRC